MHMGVLSLLLVHARDDRAALLLLLVGVTMIFGIRKLGYLKYLAVDKIMSWVEDISDELGIKRNRRKFLACEMAISESKNMEEFWSRVVSAGQLLKLDYLELRLGTSGHNPQPSKGYSWHSGKGRFDPASLDPQRTMYISLPLEDRDYQLGSLVLAKELPASAQLSSQILRRIELLRRTVTDTLHKVADKNKGMP
jgi:hypothetical protein